MSYLVNPYAYGGAVVTDPFFSNVVLLCHFDGTNGSSSFIDSSAAAHTLTATGSSSLTTAQSKFGTASLNLASSSAAASSVDSADWDFGAGQFTVETFFRANAAPTSVQSLVAQWSSAAGQFSWFLGFNAGTFLFFYSTTGSNNPSIGGAVTITPGTWYHAAADRDASNVLRLYLNGAVIASATVALTFFNSNLPVRIGSDSSNTRALQGQQDETRITKGVARYAGAFTPPAAAFPNQ